MDRLRLLTADLARVTFRASNYGGTAHEYIMREWGDAQADVYDRMKRALEAVGVDRPFYPHGNRDRPIMWRYLDLDDGYTYWTAGEALNRKPHGAS